MLILWGMKDGYPEHHEIAEIENWTKQMGWIDLMEFVQSIWWQPDWGWTQTPAEGKMIYEISTGGWSGNEEIIAALHKTHMFWQFCWQQSKRGGHYIFKVKIK